MDVNPSYEGKGFWLLTGRLIAQSRAFRQTY